MSSKTAGEDGIGTKYGNSGEGAVGGKSGRAGFHSSTATGTGVLAHLPWSHPPDSVNPLEAFMD